MLEPEAWQMGHLQDKSLKAAAAFPQRAERLDAVVAEVQVFKKAAFVKVLNGADVVVGQVQALKLRKQLQRGVHAIKAVLLAAEAGQLWPRLRSSAS